MSTATELTRISNAKAAIRTSIENKGVTVPAADLIDTYSQYIDAIPSGGTAVVEKDVNFYDWDGTLLYSYTLAEAQNLQALPALPADYKDYTADSWTETLSFINNLTYPWMVGVNYTTQRAETYIYITVPEPDPTFGEDNSVYFKAPNASSHVWIIDWGDGTSDTYTTGNTTYSHTYASTGNYKLTISDQPGRNLYLISDGNQLKNALFKSSHAYQLSLNAGNYSEAQTLITEVELGNAVQLNQFAFTGQNALKKMLIPKGISLSGGSIFSQTSIDFLTYPSVLGAFPANDSCNVMNYAKIIIIPSAWTSQIGINFSNCLSLRKINWAKEANVRTRLPSFQQCYNLETEIYITEGVTTLPQYCFATNANTPAKYTFSSIPSTVTEIPANCFGGHFSQRDTLVIPSNITYIGNFNFYNSTSLKRFIFESATPPEISSITFNSSSGYLEIYVPYGAKATYVAASYWSSLQNYIHELPQNP